MAVPDYRAMFNGQAGPAPNVVYLAGCYILSGASSVDDFIGPFGSLTYRHDEASATPDVGDDLDNGTLWSDSAEVPFSDASGSEYSVVGAAGTVTTDPGGCVAAIPGPYGDTRIEAGDTILGASWLVRWYGGNFNFRYGSTPNGEAGVDNTTEVAWGVADAVTNTLVISEAAEDVPTKEEYVQYGCKGAWAPRRPVPTMLDCLCSLLIKLAAAAARGVTLGSGYASRERDVIVG